MAHFHAAIFCAMTEELEPFLRQAKKPLTLVDDTRTPAQMVSGYLGQARVLMAATGVGLVNASVISAAALARHQIDRVFSAGSAGGLHPDVRVGDVVVGADFAYSGADATLFGYQIGQIPGMPYSYPSSTSLVHDSVRLTKGPVRSGHVVSGDAFIHSEHADRVRADFPDALAVDMESAALAHTCHLFEVPFVSVRGISDLCTPDAGSSFRISLEEAAEVSASTVIAAITEQARLEASTSEGAWR